MPALGKLIDQWRKWINRNKTFSTHEMDELENHLLEEIDDLKQYNHMTEEEAFKTVVGLMGDREVLDKEFVKSKPLGPKAVHWVKTHSLQIYSTLLLLIIVLVSDLLFNSSHFVEVYEPVSKNYKFRSSIGNSYALMTPFAELKPSSTMTLRVTPEHSEISNSAITIMPYPAKIASSQEFRMSFDLRKNDISPDGTITIAFPENTFFPNSSFNFEAINWETKAPNKMVTEPSLYCDANIYFGNYYFVLDDKAQLWIEQSSKFTINSTKLYLKPQYLTKSHFILDKSIIYGKGLEQETNTLPYIQCPPSPDDPKAIFIQPIDPYQVLLFQKEMNGIRTIRLQLYQLRSRKYPILVWDEVKLVRKPVHLWNWRITYANHQ